MKVKNVGEAMCVYWLYEHQSTYVELSRRLGVSASTLFEWRKTGSIPPRHWKKILEVTGFDVRPYVKF